MKVRFRALPEPSGEKRRFLLEVPDDDEYGVLREFLVKYWKDGKDAGVQVELEKWYKKRTVKMNNLQWELCKRIAAADQTTKEVVHDSMRGVVYKTEEHYGVWIPVAGEEHTTVEYGEAILWLVNECMTRTDPIDIHDIWVLFTHWRYGLEHDPIHYADLEEYREKHPCCESCGRFLLETDEQGMEKHVGHMHHIKTRGAGGLDEAFNILMLCGKCHQGIHAVGVPEFCKRVPHLEPKIRRVLGDDLRDGSEGEAGQDGSEVPGAYEVLDENGPAVDGDRGPDETEGDAPADPGVQPTGGEGGGTDVVTDLVKDTFNGTEVGPDGRPVEQRADAKPPGDTGQRPGNTGDDREPERQDPKKQEMLGRLSGLEHSHEKMYPKSKGNQPTPEQVAEHNEELGL